MTPDSIQTQLQPVLDRLSEMLARLKKRVPFPEVFSRSLQHKLAIELTHGSAAIEGNTLTLREAQLLIDEGIAPQGAKQLREIHETVNHHKAVLCVLEHVENRQPIGEEAICQLHRILMANIDDRTSGRYRDQSVFVTGAPRQPMRPEKVVSAMVELIEWINTTDSHPVLLAGEAHYRFVKIHPFNDGNGRTARLLLNWILLQREYPLTVIPAEYRSRYITSIDDADLEQPLAYYQLLCECVESSLDQYLSFSKWPRWQMGG